MKKLTLLMLLLIAGAFVMNAQEKEPMRSAIFNTLPSEFTQLGNTTIYYSITERSAVGPGYQTGVSLLGEINGRYYSSTYESNGFFTNRAGAGFIAAMQVNGNTAVYVNCATGTTSDGVTLTTSLEPQGDVAARIIYTLTNNNDVAATVNVGVWGDIMIGDNDRAPLERLKNSQEAVYGMKMKYSTAEGAPLLCALFGEGVTGVTPIDDYWFGYYRNNYSANQIVGHYNYSEYMSNYMQENGDYDSGLGFCWKERTIEPGESIELSYLISVGEIDIEEPIVPGEDHFTYEVEAYNIEAWNDLGTGHPAHIWGYYEHPYGQEGYIEYQVDGGEWIRIETPLTSGEDYDLEFIMRFDPENTTLHVLNLRFTDGLGNYTDLDGLSWVDVRSINVEGFEDRTYNGEPQIYNVTVGEETFVVGEDGAYVNPGEYAYQITGNYNQNTIGIQTVEFEIFKADPELQVIVPETVAYDGLPHGAIVEVLVGDGTPVVTYVNTATGEILTEAPTEIGIYEVFVEMPETEFYNGIENTSYGMFEIYKKHTAVEEITVNEDNGAWYTIEGIRVNAPIERGIYIHNGKKYVK